MNRILKKVLQDLNESLLVGEQSQIDWWFLSDEIYSSLLCASGASSRGTAHEFYRGHARQDQARRLAVVQQVVH